MAGFCWFFLQLLLHGTFQLHGWVTYSTAVEKRLDGLSLSQLCSKFSFWNITSHTYPWVPGQTFFRNQKRTKIHESKNWPKTWRKAFQVLWATTVLSPVRRFPSKTLSRNRQKDWPGRCKSLAENGPTLVSQKAEYISWFSKVKMSRPLLFFDLLCYITKWF